MASCVLCALSLSLWGGVQLYAQDESKGIDRWSFGTNAVEWLFTIPNFRVSFDFSSSEYNHLVGLVGVKYNWNTWQNTDSYFVFNVFDIRPEVRRYYRTTAIDTTAKKFSTGIAPWGRNQKKNPRFWRAYYLGVYANYTQYSIKPGSQGRQGNAFGLGLSFGYEIPLYAYKTGAVDLDLGVSAGVLYHRDQAYVLMPESAYYQASDAKQVFPVLPMITELRAVFAWRHKSVSRKYLEEDPADKQFMLAKADIDGWIEKSMVADFEKELKDQGVDVSSFTDSLYRAKYYAYVDQMEASNIINIENNSQINDSHKRKLKKYLKRQSHRLRLSYNKKSAELKAERLKKENEARAKQREADKLAREAEKRAKEEQKKLEQANVEKVKKEKNGQNAATREEGEME